MTLPPVVRVFFAIELPPAIKEHIHRFISSLKKQSKTKAIRWTRAENLHITLQFLPEVRTEHIAKLLECVRTEIADSLSQLHFSLGGLQLFPTPYRPRVIVLAITPQEALAALAKQVAQGISAAGYPVENRPYRAHLTLGRIKQPQGLNLNFLSEVEVPEIAAVKVKDIVLFRSEPQPEGSKYVIIERIALSSNNHSVDPTLS